MKNKWLISGASVLTFLVSSLALADTQTIIPSKTSFKAIAGDTIEFDVNYSASSPNQTTGLGLKLNYDSNKLSLVNISEVFSTDKVAQVEGVKKIISEISDAQNKAVTDKTINIAWASLSGNWPGTKNTDTKLLKVKFKVAQDFTSPTTINFTGDASAGNTFTATPVLITPSEKTIDSDNETSSGGALSWLFMSFLLLLRATKTALLRRN